MQQCISYSTGRVNERSETEASCKKEPIGASFKREPTRFLPQAILCLSCPRDDIQSKVDKFRVHSAPFMNFEFAANN